MFKQLLLCALLALTLSACGKSDDEDKPASSGAGAATGAATSVNTSKNYLSGACGSDVISDHNDVTIKCKYMLTDEDARNCKSTAQSFLAKYPNINCTASAPSSTSVDSTTVTVTPAKFQTVIDKLTAAGF